MKQFNNRLIKESSPYLLQHAHNPVDWYPWGEEALQKARQEDKIILVSIGYSACHWCHVMEKESFENETVASLMNAHFINIKIDREERPDLDHIYMDAVQAMTGSGGWPLNVFLTPDTKPFFGGTYFPPVKAFNRPSWTDVLQGVKQGWENRKEEIITQSGTLTEHLERSADLSALKNLIGAEEGFTKAQCDTIFQNIMKQADKTWGGFGNAPKFPQTFVIQYLLQYHFYSGNEEALQQALLSIDKMLEGGIYDHAGGGLARYSTDAEWLAPHFEKMLYDNALLLNILCDAYQLTGNEQYEKAIRKTLGFVQRELLHPEAGFYAAIDADSEGEEGKYYVWQKSAIDEILGDDSPIFCEFFDVTAGGNWEGKSILRILKKADLFAAEKGLEKGAFEVKINDSLARLLAQRNKRVRPQLDDKILLGWNAMMLSALCKVSAALNDKDCKALAERTFNNILRNFKTAENAPDLHHTYKDGSAKYPAFLDDYAILIQACIFLQEISSDTKYLSLAKQFTEHVIGHFFDEGSGYFFFTSKIQDDLIVRKKEVYDGATPSGNSIMAENLYYLSIVFDNAVWHSIAQRMTEGLSGGVVRYPSSFAIWASLILRQAYGVNEIAITGGAYQQTRDDLLRRYWPGRVLQSAGSANDEYPLLKGKTYDKKVLIYLCKDHSCAAPVTSLKGLFLQAQHPLLHKAKEHNI